MGSTKNGYRFATALRQKTKRQKKSVKAPSLATIAQRYMELRRLRERVSEAEASFYVR